MDGLMVGDVVIVLEDFVHPLMGMVPKYTLGIALSRVTEVDVYTRNCWDIALVGYGSTIVERDLFKLYDEKSLQRYDRIVERDKKVTAR